MIENEQIEKVTHELKEYIEVNYQLAKLQSIEKASMLGADLFSGLFISAISFLSVLFGSLWIANCISTYLNWEHIGLAIVGGFYFILHLFFILFNKKLLFVPARNKLIQKLSQKRK